MAVSTAASAAFFMVMVVFASVATAFAPVTVMMSATAATEIVGEIQGINEAMDQNNDVTKQLNESTMKFETV